MLNLLGPREVADVDQTLNAILELNKYTEVGEVANLGLVIRANRIPCLDACPWILLELLQTERHLALLTAESKDDSLYLVTDLEQIVGRTYVLAPAHLRYVDQALNTRSNLNECTVVGHNDNLTLHLVADLEVWIKGIPWMCRKLLQAKGDTLLLLIEVEDNDLDLLVELHNLLRIAYAAPAEVCDVDETVNATEVNEYTIRGDVLDSTLDDLALLKLRDEFLALLFELSLDEHLVADNDIAVLLVDLHNLEFHCLVDEYVIVTDWLNVNLRTWEECLDAKDINDHTTLGATLHETSDNLLVLESLVDTGPRSSGASLLVREHELTSAILGRINVNLYFITFFQVGIVAELRCWDYALALVANVYDNLTLVDSGYSTFDYFVSIDAAEGLVVLSNLLFLTCRGKGLAVLVSFPIEVFDSGVL